MNLPYIGYTYCIKFLKTNQVYYGSRCAKNCHPSEFWVTYFTSSKIVKKLINEFGKDSFIFEIRKTFADNPKDSQKWERKVLKRINAGCRQDFLNKSNGVAPILSGWKNPFFNKKHTEETKKKMKDNQPNKKGHNNPNWKGGINSLRTLKKFTSQEERANAQSQKMLKSNPMKNEMVKEKHLSSIRQMKEKMSKICSHCGKKMDPGGYAVHLRSLVKKNLI